MALIVPPSKFVVRECMSALCHQPTLTEQNQKRTSLGPKLNQIATNKIAARARIHWAKATFNPLKRRKTAPIKA